MDLRKVLWMSPAGLVALLALRTRAERDGLLELTFLAPADQHVLRYLIHIGFVQELVQRGVEVVEANPSGADLSEIRACLPVTYVTGEFEMETAANALLDTLDAIGAPPHVRHATYLVMTELTNNAWQHGSPCYVVAQTHSGQTSGTPGLHLAIADFGDGFAASLRDFKPSNERAAILMAFEERVTSTGDRNRGLGLTHTLDAVDGYPDSRLSVVSGNVMVVREKREFEAYTGPDCGGVFVAAYFPFTPAEV